ncbi:MAG TPA: nitrilase-related carbon-nitrogen hydrolase, partial [Lachnospiraceae bacterium]|nr:nitrilase-related carbon-nitrogen hydrolase [Lachnospiraceae bacterium]
MRDGFIKTAAVTPRIRVADIEYNRGETEKLMKEATEGGAKVIVFPELCLTGYTCQDLFLQPLLAEKAQEALCLLVKASEGTDALVFVGLPLEQDGKLYNTAAVFQNGKLLAFIPKRYLPNYAEFYEMRHFSPGEADVIMIDFYGQQVPFGQNLLFCTEAVKGLKIAAEICEDLWVPDPPSTSHAMNGANLIVNLS